MKQIIVVLMVLGTFLFGAEAPKIYHDFESGQKAAKQQDKPMMIMIVVEGCPECAYMKDVVFKQDKTSEYMNENFINVVLDFKKNDIPSKYPHFGVPHTYYTDKDGDILFQQIGGTRGDEFLEQLKKAKSQVEG